MPELYLQNNINKFNFFYAFLNVCLYALQILEKVSQTYKNMYPEGKGL